jgi:GntR family transcriptional regulator
VAIVGNDLDPDSPDPLYEQLAAVLRRDIDAGRITVRLPSELALTQHYGVSRGTAHRAVMILIEAGYVRISRGRGTFVIPSGERRA